MVDVFPSLEVDELHRRNKSIHIPAMLGEEGSVAGWSHQAANNTSTILLPAAKTAATFTLPIHIEIGTVINRVRIHGRTESAGNAATLDVELRATTATASAITDELIASIPQINKTANYMFDDEIILTTPENTDTNKFYYILLTGTTAAGTEIDVQGIDLNVDFT